MEPSVFNLPAYRIGPYRMQVRPGERSAFNDKRKGVSHDWTAGICFLDKKLSNRRALEWFMRHLTTAIHYRSGLNDTSDEESFTHSLATGLVELAQTNPEFWAAFNAVLEHELCPGAGWGRTARGNPSANSWSAPKQVVFDDRTCLFQFIPAAKAAKLPAFGYYFLGTGPIQISESLYGTNFALVVLHEVLHFLHESLCLTSEHSEAVFRRTQAAMLLRFWQQNPEFWAWWLHTARNATPELQLLAA